MVIWYKGNFILWIEINLGFKGLRNKAILIQLKRVKYDPHCNQRIKKINTFVDNDI